MDNKALLIVVDGYAKGKDYEGNAIVKANTPFLDELEKTKPKTLLNTCGKSVGLPEGTMGGSEVGHYTMGAGQVVMQSLPNIDSKIESGEFFENPELMSAVEVVKKNDSALHLVGMLSDAGVHSHIRHLFALLDLAEKHDLKKVYIHVITDGRDVPERSAAKYIEMLENKMEEAGAGEIVSVIGRFFAMDRDDNWDRTQAAYDLMVDGKGAMHESALEAVEGFYNESEESDYYLTAKKIGSDKNVGEEDAVIFFNYRTDRAAQLTQAFVDDEFNHFEQKVKPHFVCFGEYSKKAPVAFEAKKGIRNIGQIVSEAGFKQFRLSETEKFPHVTFFFNSQKKGPYKGEERLEIASPKVASYADAPEMSAEGVTQELIKAIQKDEYKMIVMNYANLDLVGHSADLEAAVKATEKIDECLSRVVPMALENGYSVVITGDHGNADEMTYEDGSPSPSHSMNPTQCFVLTDKVEDYNLRQTNNGLADIAPTMLQLMELPKDKEMTGESLIELA